MSNLTPYDENLVPEVFVLNNSGVLCWANSLVQALLCLPVFNKFLEDYETHFIQEKNNLGLHLLQLFREGLSASQETRDLRLSMKHVDPILYELQARRESFALNNPLRAGHQEDAHEGYQLLLNSIIGDMSDMNIGTSANALERNFHIRHDTVITCKNCKKRRVVQHTGVHDHHGEPPSICVDIPYYDTHHGYIDSQEKVQDYINSRSEFRQDHRCEDCGAQNINGSRMVMTSTVLRRLSSVIVIIFKNYPQYNKRAGGNGKLLHYFPSGLEFQASGGTILNYHAVSKIEHFGSESGGHYTATGIRRVHSRIHENRLSAIRKHIANSQCGPEELKMYKRKLRNASRNTALFNMNDGRASYVDGNIEPTENTYMVFYHLM